MRMQDRFVRALAAGGERALQRDRTEHRLARAREGEQKAVASELHLVSAVSRGLLADDGAVGLDELMCGQIAEPIEHPGVVLRR